MKNKKPVSDTPETDAVWADKSQNILDHARRMERERNEAIGECDKTLDQLESLERSILDLSHPNCKALLDERNAALAEADKWEKAYYEVCAHLMVELVRDSEKPLETEGECAARIVRERDEARRFAEQYRTQWADSMLRGDPPLPWEERP